MHTNSHGDFGESEEVKCIVQAASLYLYLVRERHMLEMGEACEHVAARSEVHASGKVYVTLLPQSQQQVLGLALHVDLGRCHSHTVEAQLNKF